MTGNELGKLKLLVFLIFYLTHLYNECLGGHAVKIVGWGVDNDVPYWFVLETVIVGLIFEI